MTSPISPRKGKGREGTECHRQPQKFAPHLRKSGQRGKKKRRVRRNPEYYLAVCRGSERENMKGPAEMY